MLRITSAESRRARAIAARSPFTSVTEALSIATSVPVPIAMPTSAAASAGASFTPSPAIATTRPRALFPPPPPHPPAPPPPPQPLDHGALLLGQDLGLDLRKAEPPRHRLGGRTVVPGQHHDPHAVLAQRLERVRRRRLTRVGHRDQPGEPALAGDQHDGRPFPAQLVRPGDRVGTGRDPDLLHHRPVAERHLGTCYPAPHALACHRLEAVRGRRL